MASRTIQPRLTEQLSVSLTPETAAEVREFATAVGVSVSEVLRTAVEAGLKVAHQQLARDRA